jgi:pilus assembly protein Flp/PilA
MNSLPGLPLPIMIGARKAASTPQRIRDVLARAQTACGQGLVEYALILVLIAIVTIGVVSELGGKTSQVFSSVNCTLAGGAQANTTTTGPGSSGSQTGASGGSSAAGTTTTGGC